MGLFGSQLVSPERDKEKYDGSCFFNYLEKILDAVVAKKSNTND